ncbi:hypothetical protein L2E12_24995, partial [Salmonella enterica subsp. enterica serovar Weltevreden]|nr:hypothetical protein [Salmonella enterica subsp. enterica serovar Weltevreden]
SCDLVLKNTQCIISEAQVNHDDVISGDFNLDVLYVYRLGGAATSFKDRRRIAGIYYICPSHINEQNVSLLCFCCWSLWYI